MFWRDCVPEPKTINYLLNQGRCMMYEGTCFCCMYRVDTTTIAISTYVVGMRSETISNSCCGKIPSTEEVDYSVNTYIWAAAVRQLLSMPPQIRGHMVSTSMCLCTTTTYSLQRLIFGVIHMVTAFLFSPPSSLPPVTHRDKPQNSNSKMVPGMNQVWQVLDCRHAGGQS